MKILKGVGLTGGAGEGTVCFLTRPQAEVQDTEIAESEVNAEKERLRRALRKTREELLARSRDLAGEEQEIMQAHAELAADEMLAEEAQRIIKREKRSADYALYSAYGAHARELEAIDDPLISQRAGDIRDVANMIIRVLRGGGIGSADTIPPGSVAAAEELLPSDTVGLERGRVAAIICTRGGQASHAAIIARAHGIPCVSGIADIYGSLREGQHVAVDALSGCVYTEPDEETLNKIHRISDDFQKQSEADIAAAARELYTADNIRIEIKLNISGIEDCTRQAIDISDGIGMYRTEYLFSAADGAADYKTQLDEYMAAAERAGAKGVVFRTLDAGADKPVAGLSHSGEPNPALGLRGLRLCLASDGVLDIQLRAILAASAAGRVSVMFPMAATIGDIEAAMNALGRAKDSLERTNQPYDKSIRAGIMLEVPSLLITADRAAAACDFASIGTNDLSQYTMAADRVNTSVSDYADFTEPAVLTLIANAAREFTLAGKPLSVCGEMAGDPTGALLLCGLGIRSLSMSAPRIPAVKKLLGRYTTEQMKRAAEHALTLKGAREVREYTSKEFSL